MKKLLMMMCITGLTINARAQKLELSIQANTGMSHYNGLSAVKDGFFVGTAPGITFPPYGKRYAASYGGGFKASVITKSKFLFGLQADYEVLRSKLNLITFSTYFLSGTDYPATGNTTTTAGFINISPFIGYRLQTRQLSIDILPGADVAIGLTRRERGTVHTSYGDGVYTSNNKLTEKPNDVRARLGLALNYRRVSVNTSYSRGIGDGRTKGSDIVTGELFRLGLGYRLY